MILAKRGPPPKPTKLKVLTGNPGKRPLNKKEPEPKPAQKLRCPSWMPADGKREWRRIVPELERLDLLKVLDVASLEMCCKAYATWLEHERIIEEEDSIMVVYNKDGQPTYKQQHPAVSIAKSACETYRKFVAEFGLTPSARSRLQIKEPENGENDDKRFFA